MRALVRGRLTVASEGAKRRSVRQTLRIAAAGMASDGPETVEIINLSATGMLIESSASLAVGELLHVELPHAGTAAATVVWTSGTFFGCHFKKPLSSAAVSAAMLKSEPVRPTLSRPGSAEPAGQPFPAQLRRLRELRGLSLETLAQKLGLSRQTIWYWERGRSLPGPDNLARLARLLEVRERDLLIGEANRTGPSGVDLATLVEASKAEIARAAGTTKDKVSVTIEF
jgi:transcriptional regulator with XRE-family HTH domain